MRPLHRADRRYPRALLPHVRRAGRRPHDYDTRGARHARAARPCAGCLHCRAGGPVRLLHERHDHGDESAAYPDTASDPRASQARPRWLPMPVRHPHAHSAGRAARGQSLREAIMHAITVMSRRDVLRTGGAVIVSFMFGAALPQRSGAQEPGAGADLGKPLDLKEVDSFLTVHANGSVTIYTSKVDVGTGLRTAMSQMVAEELGVPVERIAVVEGDTALTPDQGGTGGSTGIPRGAVEVRQAAATARQAFLRLGAERLGRPAAELTLVDGQVRPSTGGPGLGLGALTGGKRLALTVDPQAPLQDPTRYTVVGKPLLRPDVPGKCTGQHVYLQDFTVPGMLHGRAIRPPALGATLQAVDESSVRGIPDVRVVRIANFLGVVAPDEWAAVRAAGALKATWSAWEGLPGSTGLDRYVRDSPVERTEAVVSRGDPAAALPTAITQLTATYTW